MDFSSPPKRPNKQQNKKFQQLSPQLQTTTSKFTKSASSFSGSHRNNSHCFDTQEQIRRQQKQHDKYGVNRRLFKDATGHTTFYFNRKLKRSLSKDIILKEKYYSIGEYYFYNDEDNQENCLGKGNFGKVFRGYCSLKQNPDVAIKVMIINDEKTLQLHRQEALRQQLVKSDGIVSIYMSKVRVIDEQQIFLIAYELMDGQLKIQQEGHQPYHAFQMLKSILRCYSQLYKRGLIHRDLKPQNILVKRQSKDKKPRQLEQSQEQKGAKSQQNIMKISDFGAAMDLNEKKQENIFTQLYASPEQIRNRDYTDKCDVYAIGCIFFHLLVGKPPGKIKCAHKNTNIMKMTQIRKILEKKSVPFEMVQFLEACLREKETVETNRNEQNRQNRNYSRLGWQDVYLHSLFKGEFNAIPRQVAGSNILLTIKTYAESNQIDVIKLIKEEKNASPHISTERLYQLLRDNSIDIPRQDIDRLGRMFGGDHYFEIQELLGDFNKLNKDQYSNYTAEQSLAFLQMFNYTGDFIEELKVEQYESREQLWLSGINFVSFPILPPMHNLTQIRILSCQIQVLKAKLNAVNLRNLTIFGCEVERIITIRGCPNLTHLSLNNNKLRQIQGLQMLPNLQALNLQHNRIRTICNINHLKRLKLLCLRRNRISSIEGLTGCVSLRFLNLETNRIRMLSNHLLTLKQTPLQKILKIYLYFNMIPGNESNKEVLSTFRKQYPQSRVYLKQGQNQQQFLQEVYQLANLETGSYRIFSHGNSKKYMGVLKDKSNTSFVHTIEQSDQDSCFIWQLKHFEQNQYCILTESSEKKKIVVGNNILSLCQYQQEKQYEEDSKFRWVFLKRGNKNGVPVYSIQNVRFNEKIRFSECGEVKMYWKSEYQSLRKINKIGEESDLWSIEPIRGQQ